MNTRRDPQEKVRVAETLRELRVAAGLTQEEAARLVGLTLGGYRTYEQGKRSLRHDQIPVFAEAFGVSTAAITTRLWSEAPGLSTGIRGELEALGMDPVKEAPLWAALAAEAAKRPSGPRRQRFFDLVRSALDLSAG